MAEMSLHEESARIPLIISAPGKAPATTQSLAQMIDLYPTLSELAGLSVPAHTQGKSLVGLLDNPALEVHDAVYTCIGENHLVTTSRWSYARYRDGGEELYDHDKDPRQFFNLAAEPAYAEPLSDMRAKLDARLAEIGR
jgi:arylsulfatase A-like enzyme